MQQPPLLPDQILARVFRLARLDGLSVLIVTAVFALLAAAAGDFPFAIVFVLGAGAGAIELHGTALLRQREPRGMNWVIASQPFLLLVILTYCALRLTHFQVPPLPDLFRQLIELCAREVNLTTDQYWRSINRLAIVLVALTSVGFQSAMTIYYVRRRRSVIRALQME